MIGDLLLVLVELAADAFAWWTGVWWERGWWPTLLERHRSDI